MTSGDNPGQGFDPAAPDFAVRCHQELSNECGFEYDLTRSELGVVRLNFYPQGTWLCHLRLAPQIIVIRSRKRELKSLTDYYFLCKPAEPDLPIMPLGNDTAWVLRANKHYGLDLGAGGRQIMMRRIIEYLNFYYRFTRFDAFAGGPMRLRVPRTLGDLQFEEASPDDRCRAMGALWRFLDPRRPDHIQPAVGTLTKLVNRYRADVPMQVGTVLWRLRVSINTRTGYVKLYGRVPFFFSSRLEPPPAGPVDVLPVPRGLFRWEPWLRIPVRFRSALGALGNFAVASSWMLATLLALTYPFTFLLHPSLTAASGSAAWAGLWWCAAYAIAVFAVIALFVFQFDGVLARAARTAPSVLQAAYGAMSGVQKYLWSWFRPRLETPGGKVAISALWLCMSTVFLVLAFTTLQVTQEPGAFAQHEAVRRVLSTFLGHATIAFPGVPYLLGAVGFDPLRWMTDPGMTSAIVFWFRVMMMIVVFRAFWKLLGYTSPRVLYRDSRRLEFEMRKLASSEASARGRAPQ